MDVNHSRRAEGFSRLFHPRGNRPTAIRRRLLEQGSMPSLLPNCRQNPTVAFPWGLPVPTLCQRQPCSTRGSCVRPGLVRYVSWSTTSAPSLLRRTILQRTWQWMKPWSNSRDTHPSNSTCQQSRSSMGSKCGYWETAPTVTSVGLKCTQEGWPRSRSWRLCGEDLDERPEAQAPPRLLWQLFY